MRFPLRAVVPLLAAAFTSCTGDSGSGFSLSVQRDTFPDGTVHVRYSGLPEDGVATAEPELRLGLMDGDPNYVFGDVRGIDAGADGTIYVLDGLASRIRVLDSAGKFLRTISSKGEGPGEITEANGMILAGDTILWLQDHGKWMMLGLSPEGEELARVPMPSLHFGHAWDGTVDDAGRIWKPAYHSDREGAEVRREGLDQSTGRIYLKSLDPSNGTVDSVYVGDYQARQYLSQEGSGWWHIYFPYDPQRETTVDPRGGFWQVHTAGYRVARLNEVGDTTLVIQVEADPIPLSSEERDEFIEGVGDRGPESRRVAEEVADLMLDTKPLIQRLIMDDRGRLWVERTLRAGAAPVYDIFSGNGEYQGSVALAFNPNQHLPIRIRNGFIYAVVLDELDVPSIVRARVPASTPSLNPPSSPAIPIGDGFP